MIAGLVAGEASAALSKIGYLHGLEIASGQTRNGRGEDAGESEREE